MARRYPPLAGLARLFVADQNTAAPWLRCARLHLAPQSSSATTKQLLKSWASAGKAKGCCFNHTMNPHKYVTGLHKSFIMDSSWIHICVLVWIQKTASLDTNFPPKRWTYSSLVHVLLRRLMCNKFHWHCAYIFLEKFDMGRVGLIVVMQALTLLKALCGKTLRGNIMLTDSIK